jgi:hypothetical protein
MGGGDHAGRVRHRETGVLRAELGGSVSRIHDFNAIKICPAVIDHSAKQRYQDKYRDQAGFH